MSWRTIDCRCYVAAGPCVDRLYDAASLEKVNSEALDLGHGTDIVLVEQGIATEGLAKLGNDMETIETAEVIPVEQPPPPPPQEIKPDELRDVIASDASTIEQEVVKTEEPPPLEPPPPAPQVVQVKEQPEQVAVLTQQSSGDAKTGGDAKAFGLYLGQINEHVQKAKVNPRSRLAGTVVMRFTIGLERPASLEGDRDEFGLENPRRGRNVRSRSRRAVPSDPAGSEHKAAGLHSAVQVPHALNGCPPPS